jgi:hypothetical protein
VPTLDLQFAATRSLVDNISGRNLITFTRASSATFVGSDGILKTAATNEPRFDHNPTTGESLGLLVEEQRTNLLLNSATLSSQSVTVTAAAHTLSFYGTGTVTLSGASTAGPVTGTGAFPTRTTLTFTPTAGSLTLTVSGSVTNAQLEAGAFATSVIPTTTAAATRAADVASITGSAFSSWYRQDQGTMFAQCAVAQPATGGNQFVFRLSDNTYNNQQALNIDSSGFGALATAAGGVYDGLCGSASAFTANTVANYAGAYAANNLGLSFNGATPVADTTATMPTTVNRLDIGLDHNGTNRIKAGTIKRLTYWPARLPNITLQRITQ